MPPIPGFAPLRLLAEEITSGQHRPIFRCSLTLSEALHHRQASHVPSKTQSTRRGRTVPAAKTGAGACLGFFLSRRLAVVMKARPYRLRQRPAGRIKKPWFDARANTRRPRHVPGPPPALVREHEAET